MSDIIHRILLVDDNVSIHEDFRQILKAAGAAHGAEMEALEAELFGESASGEQTVRNEVDYEIDDAFQGEEAIDKVNTAAREGRPHALAFMDVRMPPGMDGIQTISAIWRAHPYIEMVICTAYSDYSWDEIIGRFGHTDHLLFVKKPFDAIAVRQIALSLTTKYDLNMKNRRRVEELERNVSQRTVELTSMIDHLSTLKAQAESAMIARSDLLSTVGCEIRTPLNGIMGMSDLLLDTNLDEEQKSYAETIKASGNSIYLILNDLLNYTRLDSGKAELATIEFDIRTALENMAELLGIKAQEKSIEIVTLTHTDVPAVLSGDPERFRQILLNLADQAIKSTPPKGMVLISVFPSHEVPRDEGTVILRIEIRDSGNGLPREELSRMLEPLPSSAVQDESARPYLATATARRICELMGGTFGIDSTEEKGTTYWCTVGFQATSDRSTPLLPVLRSIEQTRVLILGDNPISRRILTLYIDHWGGKSAESATVSETIEMLHTAHDTIAPFDMVIVDLKNGTTDQYVDIAQRIRKHRNLELIPLICLTSYTQRGDARQVRESGFSAYLTKPIKQTHLYNCIGMVKQLRDGHAAFGSVELITKHLIDEVIRERYHVLIAEHLPHRLHPLLSILERSGLRCDVARDTGELLRAADNQRYDLVLVDTDLPGNSAGIVEKIKSDRRIPVLGITGEASSGAAPSPFDGFVREPFAKQELQDLLRGVLNRVGTPLRR